MDIYWWCAIKLPPNNSVKGDLEMICILKTEERLEKHWKGDCVD
jgi:hypothetical protein